MLTNPGRQGAFQKRLVDHSSYCTRNQVHSRHSTVLGWLKPKRRIKNNVGLGRREVSSTKCQVSPYQEAFCIILVSSQWPFCSSLANLLLTRQRPLLRSLEFFSSRKVLKDQATQFTVSETEVSGWWNFPKSWWETSLIGPSKKGIVFVLTCTSLIMEEVLFIFINEVSTCITFSVDHIFMVCTHFSIRAPLFFIML